MPEENSISQDDNDASYQSNLPTDKLCLQMNYYDYYVSKPTILDRRRGDSLPLNEFKIVPVIRIFGNLLTGHQVLCHVHGIFPYIFIRYDGSNFDSSLIRRQKCALLHTLLETKMKLHTKEARSGSKRNGRSFKQPDGNGGGPGEEEKKIGQLEYIANVSIVKGIPFYGYHVGWTVFYKVSLLNPSHVQRLSDLIRDGKVFGEHRDVYESHIPYLLQFSADFNLFGSEWVQLQRCYFRKPVLNDILSIDTLLRTEELDELLKRFCDERSNVLRFEQFRRMGNGLLEIDVLPQFITNIESLHFEDLHHDIALNLGNKAGEKTMDSKRKPHIHSTKKMINDLISLRSLYSLDEYCPPMEIERYEQLDTTWQSSHEFEDLFRRAKTRLSSNSKGVTVEKFVCHSRELDQIKTPYAAVDELWPDIPACVDPQIQEDDTTGGGSGIGTKAPAPDEMLKFGESVWKNEGISDAEEEEEQDSSPSSSSSDFETEMGKREVNDRQAMTVDEDSDGENKNSASLLPSQHSQDGRSFIKFGSDLELTQTMARRSFGSNQNRVPSSPKKYVHRPVKGLYLSNRKRGYVYKKPPFKYRALEQHLEITGNPKINYPNPFFSNPRDLSKKPYIYAGRIFDIVSPHLIKRIPLTFGGEPAILETIPTVNPTASWKYCKRPPSYAEVMRSSSVKSSRASKFQTQIDKFFHSNKFSYKYPSDVSLRKNKKRRPIHDVMTHFTLEIQTNAREGKLPDPLVDEVTMIVWKLDDKLYPFDIASQSEGILVVNPDPEDVNFIKRIELASGNVPVAVYNSEFDMLEALTDLILVLDPDIISGYEVHSSSWGYIMERCLRVHNFSIAEELSRVTSFTNNKIKEYWGYRNSSGITITGRYVLNIWRVIRSSLDLMQYSVENIAYHLLHWRIPQFSHQTLSNMWKNNRGSLTFTKTVISYWLTRVRINVELIRKQEFLEKTMEQARLIGVDFRSIYYRGSQYKVESFLIRICKSESFILISPSKQQVRGQKSLECVPLVMEPEAAFYKSPLVVLDFQSLYPSTMIAYNYCYSTMLGRVRELNLSKNDVGVSSHHLDPDILKLLENDVTISPNGIVFVKPSVRRSTLAEMLTEILDIRFMVKKTMSELGSSNDALKKLLGNKQLGLKLLANVTYGYASASFSGRMPCSDLADAIVQTGRETLEKAVELVDSNVEWGAKVVYGDTDSLFVYLPGKTREDAFRVGQEISMEVTKRNPKPIFLKLEKVYHGCVLVSKKRYAGFAYESDKQKEPTFDAKGIETVRRDGYPAQQVIVETALRILFDTLDLSQVKSYIQSQFTKIYRGHVSIQDFCFAKEVKLGTYKSEKSAPPGAIVAIRQREKDHRAEPQFKERVPYVAVRSKSGELLRNRSLSPSEYLQSENLELDAEYYINNTLVPPLSRLFNIMGINVAEWATELTRVRRHRAQLGVGKGNVIKDSLLCCSCMKEQLTDPDDVLCKKCSVDPRLTAINVSCVNLSLQKRWKNVATICRTCSYQYTKDAGPTGNLIASMCESFDCPVYYSRIRIENSCDGYDNKRRVVASQKLDTW